MDSIYSLIDECDVAMSAAGLHFGHGAATARDEAAWLVLHVFDWPVGEAYVDWRAPADAARAARVRELLARRIESRVPLAYLLGEAWFCGLPFEVNAAVLVPRSPIAELIERGFEPWVDPARMRRALDLCTGSGCIAIATAVHLPGLIIDASDLSREALAVAARNVARHDMGARVSLLHSDLFAALHARRYDLVVSNPPYVPRAGLAGLPQEYRAEPEMGLVSGADGLELPLRILADAPNYLEQGGVLVCEVGESAPVLQELLPRVPFTWLEFEHGGEGVFTMNRSELQAARPAVIEAMRNRAHVR